MPKRLILRETTFDLSDPRDRHSPYQTADRILKSNGNPLDPGDDFKFHNAAHRYRYYRLAKRLAKGTPKPRDLKVAKNDRAFIKYLHTIGMSHLLDSVFNPK